MYKLLIRPVLFLFDAETIHDFVLKFFSEAAFLFPLLSKIYSPKKNTEVSAGPMVFKNSIGLAAGFDKNGIALRLCQALGFSHVEIGTVTPLAQKGNSRPRIFRLKKDSAIINRLGFNNQGADAVGKNILNSRKFINPNFIIGVNIGKNKDTLIKDAFKDYTMCFKKLYDAADYFTLNVSSPNTEGLRELQEERYLDNLLYEVQNLNKEISKLKNSALKCIFLKIAPDLTDSAIETIFKLAVKNKLTGIIATNSTVKRLNLKEQTNEQGGLSGKPLKSMSDKVLEKLDSYNKNDSYPLILIGVGGVFSKKDFEDKISSGASLVQIYTGFIYEGPGILKRILSG